ncbi:hypothetical protein [Streptomyces sp. NBC_00658]|uniref:hypothetical protein n=1 Tax=Streptomyces sp. NBC_00658 TaxID=2975800 RepID=UPI003255C27A
MARLDFKTYTIGVTPIRNPVGLLSGLDTHRLTVTVNVTGLGDFDLEAPHRFSGELWAENLPGSSGWLGRLEDANLLALRSEPLSLTLTGAVTDRQIAGLEKLREGRDLTLRLDLVATALRPIEDDWPVRQAQERFTISHSEWSAALVSVEAGAYVDVLVPITDIEPRRVAARRLREAKASLRDGRYEDAVDTSRKVLDAVKQATSATPTALKALKRANKDRDQAERWALVIQSAFDLMSGATHDDAGTTEHFAWSRADATASVAIAAGLLARLEDLPA